ncbi:MAG TPA: FAD/NAD(P)-binding oxidoreductase, partial [Dehalococcoidia bacterium]|nr:FAD/NAD(P)-binding oxidoreductase [Dehalococcoidia bacterium]
GERVAQEEGQRELADLAKKGIEWVQGEVETLDPNTRAVQTSAGTLDGDFLIVALGAERAPQAVPGFAEAALNLYEADGALKIRRALATFRGGRIVVLVSRTPFSCPSAPYEAAFLIDSILRERGLRDRSEIAIYTPEDQPMPVAGPAVGAPLVEMLTDRGIEFHKEQMVLKIDAAARRVLFEIDETSYDLLVGVPPHKAPQSVRDAQLVDASGWVPVDAATLQTRHAGVFAIGDVTAIRLANGMFLPKAGVFADGQARVVAQSIAAEIGQGVAPGQFNGYGFCYVETGGGMAAYGAGNFYGLSGPRVTLEMPAERFRKEKQEIERTALALWE